VPGWVSHLEAAWESPPHGDFYERLASFSRLILFDKRGTGLSDRVPIDQLPTLEERMDDVRAVMDAVGSRRAALLGYSEGGPVAALFAAQYPERTAALIMYRAFAKLDLEDSLVKYSARSPDEFEALVEQRWGEGYPTFEVWAPSVASVPDAGELFNRRMRAGASPSAAVAIWRMVRQTDARDVLPTIHVPTLILHRAGDLVFGVTHGRYLAGHIPGAKYVELPGRDHVIYIGDTSSTGGEIEEFLTGERHEAEPDRVLATVLFTDVVGSTAYVVKLGDRAWRELLGRFHALVRGEFARFRGREVDTAGAGVFGIFDGPGRAIRCARGIRDAVRCPGIDVRVGLHTGECELMVAKVAGIAVHIGARVMAEAKPGEVLVSRTTKDLVAGSPFVLEDRGTRELKGVPGSWPLFAVVG
jgi:class 3 adenylate cyclase